MAVKFQYRDNDPYSDAAWALLNHIHGGRAVQGYVQHDKNRRGNPSAQDRILMALEDSDVHKAEQLAFAMAV